MTNEELIDRQICQMCNQRRECIKESRYRCADYEDAVKILKDKDQQFNKVCEWLRETNIDGLCDSKNLASKFIKKLYELYNGS